MSHRWEFNVCMAENHAIDLRPETNLDEIPIGRVAELSPGTDDVISSELASHHDSTSLAAHAARRIRVEEITDGDCTGKWFGTNPA